MPSFIYDLTTTISPLNLPKCLSRISLTSVLDLIYSILVLLSRAVKFYITLCYDSIVTPNEDIDPPNLLSPYSSFVLLCLFEIILTVFILFFLRAVVKPFEPVR